MKYFPQEIRDCIENMSIVGKSTVGQRKTLVWISKASSRRKLLSVLSRCISSGRSFAEKFSLHR